MFNREDIERSSANFDLLAVVKFVQSQSVGLTSAGVVGVEDVALVAKRTAIGRRTALTELNFTSSWRKFNVVLITIIVFTQSQFISSTLHFNTSQSSIINRQSSIILSVATMLQNETST